MGRPETASSAATVAADVPSTSRSAAAQSSASGDGIDVIVAQRNRSGNEVMNEEEEVVEVAPSGSCAYRTNDDEDGQVAGRSSAILPTTTTNRTADAMNAQIRATQVGTRMLRIDSSMDEYTEDDSDSYRSSDEEEDVREESGGRRARTKAHALSEKRRVEEYGEATSSQDQPLPPPPPPEFSATPAMTVTTRRNENTASYEYNRHVAGAVAASRRGGDNNNRNRNANNNNSSGTTTTHEYDSGQHDGGSGGGDGAFCFGRHRKKTFCFGLLMIHSTFFTLFVFDLLLLSHTLLFTVSNYMNGAARYRKFFPPTTTTTATTVTTASVAAISDGVVDLTPPLIIDADKSGILSALTEIPYNLLLPLFAVQVFWLVSGIAAVAALKLVQPLLQLPYILVSSLLMVASLWLIIRCLLRLVDGLAMIEWSFLLAVVLANIVFVAQLYFLYVKIICLKALLRKRNAVVSSAAISSVTGAEDGERMSGGETATGSSNAPRLRHTSASALAARLFRRHNYSTSQNNNTTSGRKARNGNNKCCSSITITTMVDEKVDLSSGANMSTKKQPIDADCCSCASCCCDETYSTKSTIIITDENEEIHLNGKA